MPVTHHQRTGHRLHADRRPAAWAWLATGLLALTTWTGSARAADVDVGVSIQISQPGVHGRIDIGRFPQPAVVVAQPVIIGRPVPRAQPVYMWVPPGRRKHWSRHCAAYRACGVPVYFVEDRWYDDHVMRGHERRVDRRQDRREDRREDRRDDRQDRREDRH
jgi:hypothetical protein